MIREAELDEMRQELKKATEIDLEKQFRKTIDPTGSLAESLKPPELPKFSDADLAGRAGSRSSTAAGHRNARARGGRTARCPPSPPPT